MKDGNVIEVIGVYKKYKNYFDKGNSLKEKILHSERNKYQDKWVLNGIDFEIGKGEAVGIVGCNGCGKSTTLKLLTRIIYPDRGSIEIKGRVSSLLELGAGFHPDLSGYENIYLNASVFGLTRKEIDRRVDDIIRFSELKEFINNPIRTYSSGMYMKLAFSVAINVDADILLIDEILGVGDVNFQKKCFEKLLEIKGKGTTIVIVSHATGQIEKICDKSIWLENGLVRMVGTPEDVHKEYLELMEGKRILQKQEEEEERKYREQIERINSLNKKHRKEERIELERRKREREAQRTYTNREEISTEAIEELKNRELMEAERQKLFIQNAEKERAKQQEIQAGFKLEEIPEEEIWVEYYKKEANRLEAVVVEKNIEIDRLNSVVRQKELFAEQTEGERNKEIARLEMAIVEKEDEVDRVNEVILEKNEEIDRLNMVIMKKNLEIEKLNRLLCNGGN